MNKKRSALAFSLIELSIVILIIGILIIGISKGSRIIYQSRLSSARSLTTSSPVVSTEGLTLWLETTFDKSFDDAQRVDNASVITWHDINPLSTIKNDAVQNSTGNVPIYLRNGLNGLPTLQFDGSSSRLVSPLNIDYIPMPNMTMFVVYKNLSTSVAQTQALFGNFGNDVSNVSREIYINSNNWPVGVYNGTITQAVSGIGTAGKSQMITYISKNAVANGSSLSINRNLTNLTFTETGTASGTSKVAFGAQAVEGYQAANVDISEVIIFNRALKKSETTAIENYLSAKWGIKLS